MTARRRLSTPELTSIALLALVVCGSITPSSVAAACLYGPNGEVLHRSGGDDCRNLVHSKTPKEGEFVRPIVIRNGDWVPLTVGTERIYDLVIRLGYSPFDQPEDVKEYQGTQHFELVAAPGRMGEGALEERITTRLARDPSELSKIDLQRHFMRRSPRGIELLSSNRYWFGKRQDVEYEEGALLLPATPSAKTPWKAGSIREYELRIDERGEVLGIETLESEAGVFEQCLVVRYVTDIQGRKKDLMGRPKVRGQILKRVWYARGVGMVRYIERGKLETFVRGNHYVFTVDNELTLKGIRGQVVPASAAKK